MIENLPSELCLEIRDSCDKQIDGALKVVKLSDKSERGYCSDTRLYSLVLLFRNEFEINSF